MPVQKRFAHTEGIFTTHPEPGNRKDHFRPATPTPLGPLYPGMMRERPRFVPNSELTCRRPSWADRVQTNTRSCRPTELPGFMALLDTQPALRGNWGRYADRAVDGPARAHRTTPRNPGRCAHCAVRSCAQTSAAGRRARRPSGGLSAPRSTAKAESKRSRCLSPPLRGPRARRRRRRDRATCYGWPGRGVRLEAREGTRSAPTAPRLPAPSAVRWGSAFLSSPIHD